MTKSKQIKQSPSTSGERSSPTAKPQRLKAQKRSRFGCEQCRLKRTKCDESKPKCGRCNSKGISCTYKVVLQFKEDLEKQGKSFGRAGLWSKNSKKADSKAIGISYYQAIEHRRLQFLNFGWSDFSVARSLSPSIIPMEIKAQLDGDYSLVNHPLNFYITFISPIFNPNVSGYFNHVYKGQDKFIVVENGLDLPSLISYCHANSRLFNLVMSLGSVYLYKQTKNVYWQEKSVHFKDLALTQIVLSNDTTSLLTCILMILYQLANDCDIEWTGYLRCCKKLLTDNFVFPRDSVECSLLKFSLEFLHYQDTVGRTACKDSNKFFIAYERFAPKLENEIRIVSWMGCDRDLLEVISDITDLSFERIQYELLERDTLEDEEQTQKLGSPTTSVVIRDSVAKQEPKSALISEHNYFELSSRLRMQVESLNMNLFDNLIQHINQRGLTSDIVSLKIDFMMEDFSKDDFYFLLGCEVKRLSTLVYLDCCLLNQGPKNVEIQNIVKFCVVMLDMLVLRNTFHWISNLTWAVYVLASQVSSQWSDSDSLRYTILACLDKIEMYNFGNIGKVRDSIIKCWKRRDLHEPPHEKATNSTLLLGFVNDWDTFVVDADCGLSLG